MRLLIALLLFLPLNCEPTAVDRDEERAALNRQLEEIKIFIAEANCDNDGECASIAYGSKACGGPMGYLYYPTSIDVEKLEEMTEAYNRAEAEFNQKYQVVSDCMYVMPAENLECQDGDCVPANS
jgi:hypothetical protein